MICKAVVSSIKGNKCRVFIKDRGYESSLLDIAINLSLVIGDPVVVAFYDNNWSDGAVIAKV